ncbi:MAG: hypothetical protein K6F73_04860 [Lachnospiraceae bacterium]|nr:hypothetical protein [Lachnospiraceae bacterium]
MTPENDSWYQMDNVAKVFLATISKRDTKTLRVSCTLTEEIDKDLLQEAVLSAIQDRPQVQMRIRRGLFWHYMEATSITPVVTEETDRICPSLYVPAKAMLHYRVTYFRKRINLDMFHALSDGTGALEFLNIIVLDYLKLCYPGQFDGVTIHSGASADDLSQDSYKQFFGNVELTRGASFRKAYHPGGMKLPYDQLQFFEIHMPTDQILPKSKELGVSLTSYFGAAWMLAIRDEMPPRKRKLPVTITLPVNLRNYYPSQTTRNFFNNVNVTHVFDIDITLEDLAAEFDATLKTLLSEDNIKKQMDSFETMEYVAPIRAVPLFIKQLVVRHVKKLADRKVSMVFSNLGIRQVPEKLCGKIENYSAFCSSENLFSTMSSYNGDLMLGVSSPYMSTSVIKNFVRGFSRQGVDIKLYATEVIR